MLCQPALHGSNLKRRPCTCNKLLPINCLPVLTCYVIMQSMQRVTMQCLHLFMPQLCTECLHASVFCTNPLPSWSNRASATALKGSGGVCAGTYTNQQVGQPGRQTTTTGRWGQTSHKHHEYLARGVKPPWGGSVHAQACEQTG